jgi:hypothetical protein
MVTFGREAEWDGTPPLGVFEFLGRFVKAANDNAVSEGQALYLLPEFTKGDLKKELYTLMPSHKGNKVAEVASYLELVNWLLRQYADEQLISDQEAVFNRASQRDAETETQFYQRLAGLRRLCGFIHTSSQLKSRFIQGLWWEVRSEARAYNTPAMPVEILVQYAQRKGDVCRRRQQTVSPQKEKKEEKRSAKRSVRGFRTAAAVESQVKVGEAPTTDPHLKVGEPPIQSGRFPTNRLVTPCLACNKTGHWLRDCPRLDAATRAMITQAWRERRPDKRAVKAPPGRRPGAVAAVGPSRAPEPEENPSSGDTSSTDHPPQTESEEPNEETPSGSPRSSSGNE